MEKLEEESSLMVKKRNYAIREDATLPTIKTESLIMSLLVDTHGKRDVATADIVGVYLLIYMEDKVLVKLSGRGVQILCEANHKYKDFIATENVKEVIYLKLKKVLYECIQSTLL